MNFAYNTFHSQVQSFKSCHQKYLCIFLTICFSWSLDLTYFQNNAIVLIMFPNWQIPGLECFSDNVHRISFCQNGLLACPWNGSGRTICVREPSRICGSCQATVDGISLVVTVTRIAVMLL